MDEEIVLTGDELIKSKIKGMIDYYTNWKGDFKLVYLSDDIMIKRFGIKREDYDRLIGEIWD